LSAKAERFLWQSLLWIWMISTWTFLWFVHGRSVTWFWPQAMVSCVLVIKILDIFVRNVNGDGSCISLKKSLIMAFYPLRLDHCPLASSGVSIRRNFFCLP
jgi:hypothetical protein